MTHYKQPPRPYRPKPKAQFQADDEVVYLPIGTNTDQHDPALRRGVVVGQNRVYVHVQFVNEPDLSYCRPHNIKKITA